MKRIIVLTEDEYTKLKKYILDAMYDYQHTRGGIGERLQKAIDILDGEEGERNA